MKNFRTILKFCIPFFMLAGILLSCEEVAKTVENPTQSNAERNAKALAAAAMSQNRTDSTDFDDCGCYDIFNDIDFEDLTGEEIEQALNEIFDNLTEEQEAYLFEPVCTEDGVFESACIAECEAVEYHECLEEEIDDYFFGGIDCDSADWTEFPMEIELPDGSTVIVHNEEELFDALNQWFDENDEWYEDDYYDTIPPIFEDSLDWEDWDVWDCFETVYPLTVHYGNGETTTVDSEEALNNFIDNWFFENEGELDELDYESFPSVGFPYDIIINETGEQITLEDVEDYYEVLDEECD